MNKEKEAMHLMDVDGSRILQYITQGHSLDDILTKDEQQNLIWWAVATYVGTYK